MSDRAGGRRGASRTDAAKAKLAALQEQRASGKRRAELFEVEQEASVFDKVRLRAHACAHRGRPLRHHLLAECKRPLRARPAPAPGTQVDEKEYRDLVAKRRREGAGFVVGGGGCAFAPWEQPKIKFGPPCGAGQGRPSRALPHAHARAARSYADIGEEEDWDAPAPSDGEEEGEEGAELQDALATAAAEAGGGAKGKKARASARVHRRSTEPRRGGVVPRLPIFSAAALRPPREGGQGRGRQQEGAGAAAQVPHERPQDAAGQVRRHRAGACCLPAPAHRRRPLPTRPFTSCTPTRARRRRTR